MEKILQSLITAVSMAFCVFGSYLTYTVRLSNAEAPVDVKTKYGETKIIKLEVEDRINVKLFVCYSRQSLKM